MDRGLLRGTANGNPLGCLEKGPETFLLTTWDASWDENAPNAPGILVLVT